MPYAVDRALATFQPTSSRREVDQPTWSRQARPPEKSLARPVGIEVDMARVGDDGLDGRPLRSAGVKACAAGSVPRHRLQRAQPSRPGQHPHARARGAGDGRARLRPHESAQLLRAGRSSTLAYVMLGPTNPFFTDVAQGIEARRGTGRPVALLCSGDQAPSASDATSPGCRSSGSRASSSPPWTPTSPCSTRSPDAGHAGGHRRPGA